MRYRIRIITYINGRKVYSPQFRKRFWWVGIIYDGSESSYTPKYDDRESALKNIDLHFAGNSKKQTIEFEYINK